MPCDSVILNTVELANVKDHDLLEAALKAAFPGLVSRYGERFAINLPGGIVRLEGGRVTGRQSETELQQLTGQIKQAYGKETVNASAKKNGFLVQWGAGAKAFSYQLYRR